MTPRAPRSAHGRTKLAGEQAVMSQLPDTGHVVRAAWLYGEHGPNFVRTMIRLKASQPTVDVVGRRSEPASRATVIPRH
jgi:dTDP-4-dehydrorhamnose reductase